MLTEASHQNVNDRHGSMVKVYNLVAGQPIELGSPNCKQLQFQVPPLKQETESASHI